MPILCFPPDDQKHVDEQRIAESVVEFVHGKNGVGMLPPTMFKVLGSLSLMRLRLTSHSSSRLQFQFHRLNE